MSLRLLLDEQISPVVAAQLLAKRAEISIQSIHHWRSGDLLGRADRLLLEAAAGDGLTLVTYDLATIPTLLVALAAAGESHAGIIFVDDRSIGSSDFGRLVAALLALWEQAADWEWEDRVVFLRPSG
jgi:Domain of unknown function (DUF5615)